MTEYQQEGVGAAFQLTADDMSNANTCITCIRINFTPDQFSL